MNIKGIFAKILGVAEAVAIDQGIQRMNFGLVLFGLAFGPDNATHFSRLPKDQQDALIARVPVVAKDHDDWPEFLSWVPRCSTTWVVPVRPAIIAGNTTNAQPVPEPGNWFVTRGYIAATTKGGWHVRFGFRYDDVDNYVNFPAFTIKKIAKQ